MDNSFDFSSDKINSISSKISPFYSINFYNKDSSNYFNYILKLFCSLISYTFFSARSGLSLYTTKANN